MALADLTLPMPSPTPDTPCPVPPQTPASPFSESPSGSLLPKNRNHDSPEHQNWKRLS